MLVHEVVKTNKIILKLLESQTSNPNYNKKREKDESLRNSQNEQDHAAGPSNPNVQPEATVKPPNRKMMSTQTQRHQDRKRQKLSAEERKKEMQK